MSRIVSSAEKWIWNNLKMYLMQYPTCLCDNILNVVDEDAVMPADRYKDFFNQLEKHIGLGSYTIEQPTMFSNLPYITVRVEPVDLGNCNFEAFVVFDVTFATDVPGDINSIHGEDDSTKYAGNSSESVASFRKNIVDSLDNLFYHAFDGADVDNLDWGSQAFFDRLRGQTLPNPANPAETKPWKFNMKGSVYPEVDLTQVYQLKKEDRQSGLSVFHVTYKLDINCLYEEDSDKDCCC